MRLYLVRDAVSETRSEWRGDDMFRPLSDEGREQARALAEHLADVPFRRIFSSPALRCQETMIPLAEVLGHGVEVHEGLLQGESPLSVKELFPLAEAGPVLVCSHGDVITGLLRELELVDAPHPECRKGSIWLLSRGPEGKLRATYSEPPRRAQAPAEDERRGPSVTRAAVLDLGSTSFTLLIADVHQDGAIQSIVREKVMLRLGATLALGPVIPDEVAERAVEVAGQLADVVEREKVGHFVVTATAALRDADNGEDLADRIGKVVGRPVRLLSGVEEARVIFEAFRHRFSLGKKPVLGLDLGGGSLELAVGNSRELFDEWTLRLGVVRLKQELAGSDPLRKREVAALRERVRGELGPIAATLRSHAPVRAIATGGTVRALARLVHGDPWAETVAGEEAPFLTRKQLEELADKLARAKQAERQRMPGMRKRRLDLVPVGAQILLALVRELDLEGLWVSDWGLREGMLLEYLSSS